MIEGTISRANPDLTASPSPTYRAMVYGGLTIPRVFARASALSARDVSLNYSHLQGAFVRDESGNEKPP